MALVTRVSLAEQRLFAVEMNPEYRRIFQVTQLDEGIAICDSEADALQAAQNLLETPGPPSGTAPAREAEEQPAVSKRTSTVGQNRSIG